ncbi:MAG: S1/P1 Nuclease [Sphingobacteriales bacterium]|nr:MAG: S1/P1 Nuclease [Sphingobacteriales bacterium]
MKNRLLKQLLLAIALFYIPVQTMAWGTQGHRITGQIADSYLTPKARKAVQAILGNETIAMAGNWADFIKSDSTYNYIYNWHFVNFEPESTFAEMQTFLKVDTAANAYNKIQFLIAGLKKKNISQPQKVMYLKLLIHFVEDIHQPLHTGHASDKGGNDIKISWFKQESNLHTVWDSQLIDFQQLSYTEYTTAINHTTAAQRVKWQKTSLSEWIYESHTLAETLYKDVKPDDKLSYKYIYKNIGIVNEQLLKGGVRLAGLLNSLFV